MPIFNPEQPEEIVIKEKIANTATSVEFDSELVPGKIINQLAGYKWKVDYYSLIAGVEDFKTDYDSLLSTPTTQYVLIKNLTLYLESPMDNTKPLDLSIDAYVILDYVPKLGDIVAAKLMDGRLILFKLTEVERNNYNLYKIYKISLKTYLIIDTPDDPVWQELNNKVVETLIYNEDISAFGDKNLYTEKQISDIYSIRENISKLLKFYTYNILRPETKYYPIFRGSDDFDIYIYDPYLEDYMLDIIGRTGLSVKVNTINYLREYRQINDTIFGYLKHDAVFKEMIKRGFGYKDPAAVNYNPYLSDIAFSYIDKILVSADTVPEAEYVYIPNNQIPAENIPVVSKDSYVLSNDFYNVLFGNIAVEDVTLSRLEISLLSMLNEDIVDFNTVDVLTKDILKTSKVQQYYYIPLIIHLSLYSIYCFATNKI